MKKYLLAATVLGAVAGLAQAQSAVTVYGSIENGIRNLTNTNANGDSKLTMGSLGTYSSNRLGFKGVEDLGGGLKVRFVLETGFAGSTGALDNATNALFNRTSIVGIDGAYGTLELGRQFNVAFKTMVPYEPMNIKYTYITSAMASTSGVRNSNDIQYTGTFGSVTARAQYSAGEVAGSVVNGAVQAAGLSYREGPVYVGAAYTKKKTLGAGGVFFDYDHYTMGGAYDFGNARIMAGYTSEKQATATVDTTNKYVMTGAAYSITPLLEVTGAYYAVRNHTANIKGDKDLAMLSGTYALSKRTKLYAEIDRSKLKGNLVLFGQTHQTGFSTGLYHQF